MEARSYVTVEELKRDKNVYVPHNLPDLNIHRVHKSWRPPPDQRRYSDISDEEEVKLLKLPHLPTVFSPNVRTYYSSYPYRQYLPRAKKNYRNLRRKYRRKQRSSPNLSRPESTVENNVSNFNTTEEVSGLDLSLVEENPIMDIEINTNNNVLCNSSITSNSTGDCTNGITKLHVAEDSAVTAEEHNSEESSLSCTNYSTVKKRKVYSWSLEKMLENESDYAADVSTDRSSPSRLRMRGIETPLGVKRRGLLNLTNVTSSPSSESNLKNQREVCQRLGREVPEQARNTLAANVRRITKRRLAEAEARRKERLEKRRKLMHEEQRRAAYKHNLERFNCSPEDDEQEGIADHTQQHTDEDSIESSQRSE